MLVDRVPPQNLEAEQAVLGSMLIEKEAVFKARNIVKPTDYYRALHGYVHEAICALVDRGEPADMLTVAEELRRRGLYEEFDTADLANVANAVPTAANVEHYADIVRDKSLKRQFINAATVKCNQAWADETPATEIAAAMAADVARMADSSYRNPVITLGDTLLQVIDEIETVQQNKQPPGLATGLPWLDRMTGGLQPGELTIIAARPSAGKTALLTQLLLHIAKATGKCAYLASQEMTAKSLGYRMLAGRAGIEQYTLRTGYGVANRWPNLTDAFRQLSQIPLLIDDAPRLTTDHIRAQAWKLAVEGRLAVVGIDYLQILKDDRLKGESRTEQVGRMSGALKALARELNVPVVCLSQLSRSAEGGENAVPDLSRLRDSGAIEQDADIVIFLHGDKETKDSPTRTVTLDLAKQRNGPTGKRVLTFNRAKGEFFEQIRGGDMNDSDKPDRYWGGGDDEEGN
jgi:replicative DNA helicase